MNLKNMDNEIAKSTSIYGLLRIYIYLISAQHDARTASHRRRADFFASSGSSGSDASSEEGDDIRDSELYNDPSHHTVQAPVSNKSRLFFLEQQNKANHVLVKNQSRFKEKYKKSKKFRKAFNVNNGSILSRQSSTLEMNKLKSKRKKVKAHLDKSEKNNEKVNVDFESRRKKNKKLENKTFLYNDLLENNGKELLSKVRFVLHCLLDSTHPTEGVHLNSKNSNPNDANYQSNNNKNLDQLISCCNIADKQLNLIELLLLPYFSPNESNRSNNNNNNMYNDILLDYISEDVSCTLYIAAILSNIVTINNFEYAPENYFFSTSDTKAVLKDSTRSNPTFHYFRFLKEDQETKMFYFLFYELIFLRDYKKNKRTLHFLLSAVSNLFCLPRCFTIIKNMNNKLLYETTVYPNPLSEDNRNPSNSSNEEEEEEVDVDLKSDTESNNNNNSAMVYNKKDNLRRFALMLLSLFYTRGSQQNRGSYIFSSEVALVTVFVDGLLNLMDSFKEHYKVQKKLEEFYAAKNIKVNNNNSDNDVDKVTEEDFYLFLTTLVFGDALRDSCENSNKTNKNLFFNLQQLLVHFDDQQYCSTQILKFLEIVSITFCSVT